MIYIQHNQFDCAKYHINKVTKCYLSHGWYLPYEVECWIHQPWFEQVTANEAAPINYMSITDRILCEGSEEAVAIVTGFDPNSQRVNLVYGYKKRTSQKLRINVVLGVALRIFYLTEQDGKIRILSSTQISYQDNLEYAKIVEGLVRKRTDKDFAFLQSSNDDFYISPKVVRMNNLQDGMTVKTLIVYDYNKKKEEWSWSCISILK